MRLVGLQQLSVHAHQARVGEPGNTQGRFLEGGAGGNYDWCYRILRREALWKAELAGIGEGGPAWANRVIRREAEALWKAELGGIGRRRSLTKAKK